MRSTRLLAVLLSLAFATPVGIADAGRAQRARAVVTQPARRVDGVKKIRGKAQVGTNRRHPRGIVPKDSTAYLIARLSPGEQGAPSLAQARAAMEALFGAIQDGSPSVPRLLFDQEKRLAPVAEAHRAVLGLGTEREAELHYLETTRSQAATRAYRALHISDVVVGLDYLPQRSATSRESKFDDFPFVLRMNAGSTTRYRYSFGFRQQSVGPRGGRGQSIPAVGDQAYRAVVLLDPVPWAAAAHHQPQLLTMLQDVAGQVNHDHLAHNAFSPQEVSGELGRDMGGATPIIDENGVPVAGAPAVTNRFEFNSQLTQFKTMQAHFARNPGAKRAVIRRALAFEKMTEQLYQQIVNDEVTAGLAGVNNPSRQKLVGVHAAAEAKAAGIRDFFLDAYVIRNLYWILEPARQIDPARGHTIENVQLQELIDRHVAVVDGKERKFLAYNRKAVAQVWHAANNDRVAAPWKDLPGVITDYRARRGGYSTTPFPTDRALWKLARVAPGRSRIAARAPGAVRASFAAPADAIAPAFRDRALGELYQAVESVLGAPARGGHRGAALRAQRKQVLAGEPSVGDGDAAARKLGAAGDPLVAAGLVVTSLDQPAKLDRRGRLEAYQASLGGSSTLVVEFPRALVELSDRRAAADQPIASPSLARRGSFRDLTYGVLTGLSADHVELYLPGQHATRTFSRHEFELYWHRGARGARLLELAGGETRGRGEAIHPSAAELQRPVVRLER